VIRLNVLLRQSSRPGPKSDAISVHGHNVERTDPLPRSDLGDVETVTVVVRELALTEGATQQAVNQVSV